MTTRFRPGLLLGADLSQIELRVAALLSGDPGLMGTYLQDGDRHTDTTKVIFGPDVIHDADFDFKRKIGKTLNFLVLFQGGSKKFQETIRRMHGREVPLPECLRIIREFDRQHPTFREWQESLVRRACLDKYLELPFTGDSRTFAGSFSKIRNTYTPTICNFPIQTTAANIMKAAQREIADEIRRRNLHTKMCLNIYDAVYLDVPSDEEEKIRALIHGPLTCPRYYQALQSHVGRSLPIRYDVEVLDRRQ